jgi:putative protease
MHIHNLAGVKQMQKEGAARAVMARETPIELIRQACETGMDIEVFAYGAICISYSGQCLMSAQLKNRSANRGMCAQCCRLRYVHEDGTPFQEGDYLLSPKDLNVIEDIPQLIEAGVASLKIEGRMKRPAYVYLVVKTFREAIDAYYSGQIYHVSPQREKQLEEMFNRGFSRGHLFHDDVKGRMSHYRPNHQGVPIGKVVSYQHEKVTVRLSDSLHQHDGLRILNVPHDTGLTAVRIEKKGKLVAEAKAGDTVVLSCSSEPHPKKGQILLKTSDTVLMEQVEEEIRQAHRTVPVTMAYEAEEGKPFVLTVEDEDGHRISVSSEEPLQRAEKAPLKAEKLHDLLTRTGDTAYEVRTVTGQPGHVFMPVSRINETRRRAFALLDEKRSVLNHYRGEVPYQFSLPEPEKRDDRLLVCCDSRKEHIPQAHVFQEGKNLMPVVQESEAEERNYHNCLLSEIGNFYGSHEHCIAGMTLNIANSYAMAFILSHPGLNGIIFSSECSESQIQEALTAFAGRYGFIPCTYRLVYGERTLMYIKDRFTSEPINSFRDIHGQSFNVKYNSGCTEIRAASPSVSANAYCFGSLIMEDEHTLNSKEIETEAYEEISRRI